MIRRSDNHRIDVFSSDDFMIVARGECVLTIDFFHVREPPIVAVARGHQFHTRNRRGETRIALAHAARPDEGNLNRVVRRIHS